MKAARRKGHGGVPAGNERAAHRSGRAAVVLATGARKALLAGTNDLANVHLSLLA